jgi:hypothetical protein
LAAVLLGLVLAGCGVEMARVPHLVTFSDAPALSALHAPTAVADSPSAVPVVYRENAQSQSRATALPRATLLKAVMRPVHSQELSGTHPLRQPQRKTRAVKLKGQPARTITAPEASVPIAAHPYGGRFLQAVYVLPDESSPSYAAVRFADGWLIVQL